MRSPKSSLPGGGTLVSSPAGRSHHRENGRYGNPWNTGGRTRFGGFLRWVLLERPFKKLPRDPDPSSFPRRSPEIEYPGGEPGSLGVTWIGHASVLLQIGPRNVLTDPMWSERASPLSFAGPKRWAPPGVRLEDLPPIDLVVQSHNHYDHLDSRTVEAIARRFPGARWLVPLGLAEFVRKRGVSRVVELDWWQEEELCGLRVACTPAQHFSGRGLLDRNSSLWCGWAFADGARRVFFAGDTGLHPEFEAIGQRYGKFDMTLLPIGAYEPAWFMRPAHMNPEEALRAYSELDGGVVGAPGRRVMVPIHYGTFKLTDEAMDEPPIRTRTAWREAGLATDDLWLLAHGESRRLDSNLQ